MKLDLPRRALVAGLAVASAVALVVLRVPVSVQMTCGWCFAFVVGASSSRTKQGEPLALVDALIAGLATCLATWTIFTLPYIRDYAFALVPLGLALTVVALYRVNVVTRIRDTTVVDSLKLQGDKRFRALVEHSNDVIAVLSEDGKIAYISRSCFGIFGHIDDELVDRKLIDFIHPDDRRTLNDFLSGMRVSSDHQSVHLELRVKNTTLDWLTLDITATDLRDEPGIEGIVLNIHDVTRRKSLEEDLRRRVLHDSLTGIANRVLFQERAAHALAGRDTERLTAALFIDLDDFKTVNDSLGHAVGDELLKVIAFRLSANLRRADTPARLGGDEFAVLIEDVPSVEEAMRIGNNLVEVLREPLEFSGHEIRVSASIGVALVAGPGDAEVLLRNADVAMYYAKRNGKGCVELFNERMHEDALERLELKADLAHAIERDELRLVYQPLVNIETRELSGFEALLRWHHPKRGLVPPDRFVPIAEDTGLIVPIGSWVVQEATRQLGDWQRRFPHRALSVNVNVSPLQVDKSEVVEMVQAALKNAGIDSKSLTLELTESTVMEDSASCERLVQLGRLGVGIAADDFGSGFASYAALQQLPFTMLKIDRTLLSGINTTDGRAETQLQSIIGMAHATGIKVVAEGIETEDQLVALEGMECDGGQGYFFSAPMDVEKAEELLATGAAWEGVRI